MFEGTEWVTTTDLSNRRKLTEKSTLKRRKRTYEWKSEEYQRVSPRCWKTSGSRNGFRKRKKSMDECRHFLERKSERRILQRNVEPNKGLQSEKWSSALKSNGHWSPKILGQGSFGVVYLIQVNGKSMAAKVCKRPNESKGEDNCLNFNHPNIVKIYGILNLVENNSNLVLNPVHSRIVFMQYGGRKSLQNLLSDDLEEMSDARYCKMLFQISSAVAYCHSQSVLHLDIKPANVVVNASDHCMLVDFGSSWTTHDNQLRSPKTAVGTIQYTAPEIFRGQTPTEKCDIYSLGILQWQMRTRDLPYKDLDPHSIIYQVVARNLRPPLGLDANSSILVDTIKRCWISDPLLRPTATDLHQFFAATHYQNQS